MHSCSATWIESAPVREIFRGETVWDGDVQIFDLHDHPKATRVYAWSHESGAGGRRQFYAVLEAGPVTSPVTAIRASIVAMKLTD